MTDRRAMTNRRAVLAVVVALVVGAGLVLLGVEVTFAVAWGVLVGTVVLVTAMPRSSAQPEQTPRRTETPWVGSDVSRLAWAINPRSGAVGEAVIRRVRAILRRRLAASGIDVDDPAQSAAVDERLGAGVWSSLTSGRTQRADIERALDAADRLSRALSETSSTPLEEHP